MALRYAWFSLVQGSNDAFVQAELDTGLSGLTREVWRLRELLIQWPALSLAAIANTEVQLAITRVSMTAQPSITERALVWTSSRLNRFVTSGMFMAQMINRERFDSDDNVLIAENTIYAQMDSANTSATNTGVIRVGYEIVRVSEAERLSLRLDALAEQ